MASSWFRCCFQRRDRKEKVQLDERFGDTSISAPIPGGWIASEKVQYVRPNYHIDAVKQIDSSPSSYTRTVRSRSSSSSRTARSDRAKDDDTPTVSESERPYVVYKPASEAFLQSINQLGRPRQAFADENDDRKPDSGNPRLSRVSAEMPCHPSYQAWPLVIPQPYDPPARIKVSPTSPTSLNDISMTTRSPSTRSPSGDRVGGRSASGDRNGGTVAANGRLSEVIKPRNDVPTQPKVTAKPRKHKRARVVTKELVPSTAELFG